MRKFLDTLIMLAAVGGSVAFTVVVSDGDYRSTTNMFNFIFLGVMSLLYLIALFSGFYKMHRLSSYLSLSSGTIEESRADDSLSVGDKVALIKGYRPIDTRLEAFLYDLRNSQSGICDVEAYVNMQEADTIVNKWYLDLVPDIMTSLGILGTFLGLVWGMRSFNPSDFELMTSSVSSLIDGIKVAFLTSIYGMALSLTFSYSVNKGYAVLTTNVITFIDRFHACIIPPADLDAQNRMVHNQAGQYEVIRAIGSEFSDQMSTGFTQSIAPTLKRIDDALTNSLQEISETQSTFLQEVSESYKKMDESNLSSERIVNVMTEILQRQEESALSQNEVLLRLVESQKELVSMVGKLAESLEE